MPYKNGKKWVAQVRQNGQKRRKVFPTKSEALAWEVEQKQITVPLLERTDTISLIEWAEKYLDYASIKFSYKTYDEKCRVFKNFFKSISPNLLVTKMSSGVILKYLQEQAKKRTGYAANKERKNLVAAWNWGIKYMSLPSPNPCLVDRFPEVRQTRYVPPIRDFWKIYDQAESEQDQIMLLAYLHLAARKSELFHLRWDDVDFSESRLRLFTRKRKDGSLEFDWLPMTDELHESMLFLHGSSKSEWVFPDPKTCKPYFYRNKWLGGLCKKAKVKRFGLHGVRHLTASILAQKNVAMIDIQSILRHKNLSTTEKYIRRIATLRPALKVLPGRKSPRRQEKAPAGTRCFLKVANITN